MAGSVVATASPAWAQAKADSAPTVLPELPATPNYQTRPQANNTPMLAQDPTEGRFVVLAHRRDAPDFGCGLQISGDSGRRFAGANPVEKLPEGAEKCYAPEVGFDAEGVLYYLFIGLHGEGNEPMGVFLTTSNDRARTWSSPERVLGPLNFGARMAIDRTWGRQGRIHLVWIQASGNPGLGSFPPPPNPIMAAHSDDGGQSFSEPVQVSDPARERVVAPSLALGADHAVHVLYYDLRGDARDYHGLEGPTWEEPWSLVLATSTDSGSRFGTGTVVDDGVMPPERVMLIFTMPPASVAADDSGVLFVAWHDARNGDWDVFLRRSDDGGRTWSVPQRLNDDPQSNGRHQYQPRLSVGPGGRLDVVFYDRRDDPDNVANQVYFAFSTDGGRRFSPNVKLTTQPSSSRIGPRYLGAAAEGMIEFGSRLGLLSTTQGATAAWTDTRNSAVPSEQDLFSTQVSGLPKMTDRRSGPLLVALVVVLVLATVVVVAVVRRRGRGGAEAL